MDPLEPSTPSRNHDDRDRLADRIDAALQDLWQGDPTSLDRLMLEHSDDGPDSGSHRMGHLVSEATAEASSPGDLPAGQVVDGYQIVGVVGRGGMGTVYKAQQREPSRRVALKVLDGSADSSARMAEVFRREIQTLAQLRHTSIATIYGAGRTPDGRPYFAMEYLDGLSLTEYVKSCSHDHRTILRTFIRVCQAVEFAHSRGILHRDLKPSNILVSADGEPHLLDFGLARMTSAGEQATLLREGSLVGTLPYISPEQASGDPQSVDERSDVYALGVMLFQLLTGRLPHAIDGKTPYEVLRTICDEPPTRLAEIDTTLRGDLDAVVHHAMASDSAQRYQSAAQLIDDIERYLRGERIVGGPADGSWQSVQRVYRRHERALLVGFFLVLLVGSLAGAFLWTDKLNTDRVEMLRWRTVLAGWALDINDQRSYSNIVESSEDALQEGRMLQFRIDLSNGLSPKSLVLSMAQEPQDLSDPMHLYPSAYWALYNEMDARDGESQQQPLHGLPYDKTYRPTPAHEWYLWSFAFADLDRALESAQEAYRLSPQTALYRARLGYLNLALALAERTDPDLRETYFDQAYEMGLTLRYDRLAVRGGCMLAAETCLRRGQYAQANEEINIVIEQHPALRAAYQTRAIAALCLDDPDYETAFRDFTTSIERSYGAYSWTRYWRATPAWILGRFTVAEYDYRSFLAQESWISYAHARMYLVQMDHAASLRQRGRLAEAESMERTAREFLIESCEAPAQSREHEWIQKIVSCLRGTAAGDMTPAELVADEQANKTTEHLCEAYYYAGERCRLEGRVAEAIRYFRLCVEMNIPLDPNVYLPNPMNEWHLARWRLNTMSEEEGR
ncbi:MAG: serine/threonine protein kinase [Planctomycetes bacterium]|nr:serine/threonine protein kinase [Planctomycetota bacterium]NOG53026.1 protein kinase [Planctomycetota bacterium]